MLETALALTTRVQSITRGDNTPERGESAVEWFVGARLGAFPGLVARIGAPLASLVVALATCEFCT
jgi:hypothetical protein